MDFAFTEQQEMLRKMARDFGEKECPKSLVRQMEEDNTAFPRDLWRKMAELGWMELIFPERYEGSPVNFMDFVVVMEEVGRACIPGPFFSSVVLGGMTVLGAGSAAQKQAILPALTRGELLVTLALTEADGAFEASSIKTKAVPKGDGYAITGAKLFVPDAQFAHKIICAAKAPEGITLFLVDAKAEGLSMTPLKTITGDRQAEVVFKNVPVQAGDILGKPGEGWDVIASVLNIAKVAKCAEMVGLAQKAMEMAVDYAKQRVQFDRPIGSFQVIQHYCAAMLTDVETSRFLTYKAASMLEQGAPCAKEVAVAKGWTSSACRRVGATAHQINGALGFSADHDLGLFYKRLKGGELMFGHDEEQKELVAQAIGL